MAGLRDAASPLARARILFVFHGSEQGGAEHQGMLLASELKKSYGARITVLGLAAQGPGRVAQRCRALGIPWQQLPFHWHCGWKGKLFSLYRLARALRKLEPDIILPYTYLPNVVCSLVWRFTGARLCVWNQRDEGRCLDRSWWHRTALLAVNCRVSNSGVGKDFLEREFSLGEEAVHVVPNALIPQDPVATREEWRSEQGVEPDAFLAVMVANLHRYKDHKTLLRAWRTFLDLRPEGRHAPLLLLAGRFDGAEVELRALAAQLKLEEHVRFLGEVREVFTLLAAADLYLHSSRAEGVPNALLEAMSAGLPVVATDIPGIREAVGASGLPYLAQAGDSGQMAALIEKFHADVSLRREVGEKLRKKAQEHTLQATVDASVTVMSRYLGR